MILPGGRNHADTFLYIFLKLNEKLKKMKFLPPLSTLAENLGHLGQRMNYFRAPFNMVFLLYVELA